MSGHETYGKLIEGLHITGYTFERACSNLETLLEGEAWRLDGRFNDPNEFLDSLRLDKFRAVAEQRKRIATRIKELQPAVSNRQIARTLGVSHQAINDDLGNKLPRGEKNTKENNGAENASGKNLPRSLSGEQAAKLIERRETGNANRIERVAADEARVLNLTPIAGRFRTIVLDPAWEYDDSFAGRAKPAYAMQTHEELMALDVRAWADENAGCHLYLWTTNAFMARACELMAHWGFQHRTLITWIKPPPFGLGGYFRNATEHALFGTLGETTTRHVAASIPTHFIAPRGEHSEKPEAFYDIVRAASYPPFGEGNQREPPPGFVNLFEEARDLCEARP
jgi:N6-adenosine-specific RNA methylase IME4